MKVFILNVVINMEKYFDKNSKKRDLSGGSITDEARKII